MATQPHFLCVRCGTILVGFPSKPPPAFCPRCGGVILKDIGEKGDYTPKEVRKEHSAPFRQDLYYRNTST